MFSRTGYWYLVHEQWYSSHYDLLSDNRQENKTHKRFIDAPLFNHTFDTREKAMRKSTYSKTQIKTFTLQQGTLHGLIQHMRQSRV